MMIPALVIVTTSFPIKGDGSEAAGSFVSDLALEISKHRPVRLVAPGPESSRETWAKGVEVFRFKTGGKPLSNLRFWRPSATVEILRILLAGKAATSAAVAAGPTAHILALWALPCGAWARWAGMRQGVSYSVWTLGSDIWSLGRIPVIRSYLRLVLKNATNCYSDGLALARETSAIAKRPVQFLPSSRNLDAGQATPVRTTPPYRLLFLGRWHPNKGVDVLLEALEGLADDCWARIARVDIEGGGPLEELVRRKVSALAQRGRPVHAGCFLDKSAAERAFARADWVLIPSRIESIPVVFSDAMRMGRPVISTPVGDLPALATIHRVGLLSEGLDGPGYARAIEQAVLQGTAPFLVGISEVARQFSLKEAVVPTLVRLGSGPVSQDSNPA